MKKLLGLLLLVATMTTTLTATASVDYARTEIVYSTSLPIEKITTVETSCESFLVSEIEASTLYLDFNDTSIENGDVGWSKEALYIYTKDLDSTHTDSAKDVGWSYAYFSYKVKHPFKNSRETIRTDTENVNSDKENTSHYRNTTEHKRINILAKTTRSRHYIANILTIKIMPTLNNAVIRTLSLVGI